MCLSVPLSRTFYVIVSYKESCILSILPIDCLLALQKEWQILRSTLYIFKLGSSAANQVSVVEQVPKGRKR